MSSDTLVANLTTLVREREEGSALARAQLGRLANDARKGQSFECVSFVLASGVSEYDERAAILFTKLFAMHPTAGGEKTLSAILGQRDREQDGSIKPRFRALLTTPAEDLEPVVRNLLGLAGDDAARLNWRDLYFAIRNWEDEPDPRTRKYNVKLQWARDFVMTGGPDEQDDGNQPKTSKKEASGT